jgi:diaminohydroxyphosphoribosylaminopyrimidine deaminase / 5-amino-6-(5-phosphoribosylamino)uracil reductase
VTSAADQRWMARCLELAARGGSTSPNPQVGCVIVSARGRLLAEGWHRGPGTAHAEIDALAALGARARGATLYVNLEPCNHVGRTPPCAPVVIAAGLARVVIGAMDPIVAHSGGARRIARAGIATTRGVLAESCREHNRGFFSVARRGRPWVTLKAASTLDGRIALTTGESRWITGPVARAEVHALRARHDAVLVGIGTALADDPRLTVRAAAGIDPIRIVLDSRARLPTRAAMLGAPGRTIVVVRASAPSARRQCLIAAGAEVWTARLDRRGRVDVGAVLAACATAGIASILVEGGGEVHASFLAADLADEVILHVAPVVFGGRRGGAAWVGGAEVARLADAHRFVMRSTRRLGADLEVVLRPEAANRARPGDR